MNRELISKTLMALEHAEPWLEELTAWNEVRVSIEALKQELAKPEPEPVAWMYESEKVTETFPSKGEAFDFVQDLCLDGDHKYKIIPLYAAPTEPNCLFPTCHSQEYQRELVKEIIEDRDTASW